VHVLILTFFFFFFLWNDRVEGGDLLNYVEQRGRISEDEGKFFFHQLAVGVKYLHDRGVVHRDLKVSLFFFFRFFLNLSAPTICSARKPSAQRRGPGSAIEDCRLWICKHSRRKAVFQVGCWHACLRRYDRQEEIVPN